MTIKTLLPLLLSFGWLSGVGAAPFDAAPFGLPLPEGQGVQWEDPREVHRVVVHFHGPAPSPDKVRLEYWGSHWPQQHLPKDRQPGGADVGWMELGNWYKGGWRFVDVEAMANGSAITFSPKPINATEFPAVKDYPASFRYTLKLRVSSDIALAIERIEAFTDSQWTNARARVVWAKPPGRALEVAAFNGEVEKLEKTSALTSRIHLRTTSNTDPNTFDRTLVTVRNGKETFTFAMDDLKEGALFLPDLGAAVLPEKDQRDYASVASAQRARGEKTLYERVGAMPEQTWQAAWAGIPRKKSDIYFPLGLDGGRQRFRLEPDGRVQFHINDYCLRARPGRETPRLALESSRVTFAFGMPARPAFRTIEEGSIPICRTTWETNGVRVLQTALLTELSGSKAGGPVPPADATAVCLLKFIFTNISESLQSASLPLGYRSGDESRRLRVDADGLVWSGTNARGQVLADQPLSPMEAESPRWTWTLSPGESRQITVKIPFVVLTEKSEQDALRQLDFEKEHSVVAAYWRRRLDESSRLTTPEPMLDDFYRAHAGHLLINCEREPNSTRRFARVGSFNYGAYGNESCMMVVDLDRRGYHREAQECLEAWLHYQGTVALPGDFASKDGVLYGAGGYEAGGYNQHHGWILWCLVEHFRFTRDESWLRSAAPGILKGADWIIRETRRTANRNELERGLLPAGSLEDIGDWWTWLSTSCYTWRGLDAAAWALEQIKHPEASRVRVEADTYHAAVLTNFRKASERSPVVRLRDGTAIPKIPSYVQRRGRSFGWICETLEGPLHLLITRALDARSREADWIVKDYEDNLYLSNQYGYTVPDFQRQWFDRGGMSMQACLLFHVEPYLFRDDTKQALRGLFNAESVSYFPDVRMNTEHAAPYFDDWRGDHYKSSDEANACGWLRQLFVREDGDVLLVGQAIPRGWLKPGARCGLERAATYFGPMSVSYGATENEITARLDGPTRNPPSQIRLRFRAPSGQLPASITVNGKLWKKVSGDWVELPGKIGAATVVARLKT